ncbi:MAG: S16 family serine protease [Fervidicoccus fontis]
MRHYRNKSEKFFALFFTSLFILFLVVYPIITNASEIAGKSIEIFVPAVTEKGGVILKLKISLIPNGSGNIYIKGALFAGNDTLNSAAVAFYVGLLMANKNPMNYNGIIEFTSPLTQIEGPSASLAIAEAFYMLAKDMNPTSLSSSVITGAINIDGLSVVIGGVEDKLNASINSGASYFYLPYSNYNLLAETNSIQNIGNINIIGVGGIASLSNSLRGINALPSIYMNAVMPTDISNYMGEVALYFMNKTKEISYNFSISNFTDITNLVSQGENYTASSLSFTLYIDSLYYYLQQSLNNKTLVEEYIKKVNETINELKEKTLEDENKLTNNDKIPISLFEIFSTEEERIWEAQGYLNMASQSQQQNDTAYYLAYAIGRLETAKTWYDMSKLNISEGQLLNLEAFQNSMKQYIDFLSIILNYINSIISQSSDASVQNYYKELLDIYNKICSNSTDIFLKYSLASVLTYDATSLLSSMNYIDEYTMQEYYNEDLYNFEIFYSNLLSNGISLFIPLAYYQYSSSNLLTYDNRLYLLENSISCILPFLFYSFNANLLYSTSPSSQVKLVIPSQNIIFETLLFWGVGSAIAAFFSLLIYHTKKKINM